MNIEVYTNSFLVNFESKKNISPIIKLPSKASCIILLISKKKIKKLPIFYHNNETIKSVINNNSVLNKFSNYGDTKELTDKILHSFNKMNYSLFFLRSLIYNLIDTSFIFLNQLEQVNKTQNSIKDKLAVIHQIITTRISAPPTLNELSVIVGLNLKTIKQEFKKEYGSPVFTYLLDYKMKLAKDLLLEKELNINEISIFLGYSTSSHFIFAFKKKFEITPKQFQKIDVK